MGMYLRRFLLLFVLLGLTIPPLAQAENQGLIWKVQGRGCTVWVAGSVHFGTPDMYPLPASYETAYAKSKILAVEADITSMSDKEVASMLQLAAYPPGDGLSKHVSPRVLAAYEKAGIDLAPYEPLRPWYALMAAMQTKLATLGYQAELGVDMHLLARAGQDNKSVLELEGVDAQFQLMDRVSRDADKFMEFSLNDLDKLETTLAGLKQSWLQGDAGAMSALVFGEMDKHPDMKQYYKAMYFDRNKTMGRKIAKYLRSGKNHFVLVGAAHLVGPRSVIANLKQRGFDPVQQ